MDEVLLIFEKVRNTAGVTGGSCRYNMAHRNELLSRFKFHFQGREGLGEIVMKTGTAGQN